MAFPEIGNPGIFVGGLGLLGLTYMLEGGGCGYFRQRMVEPHLKSGRLYLVAGAPSFFYPIYAVCSMQSDAALLEIALQGLREIVTELPTPKRTQLPRGAPSRSPRASRLLAYVLVGLAVEQHRAHNTRRTEKMLRSSLRRKTSRGRHTHSGKKAPQRARPPRALLKIDRRGARVCRERAPCVATRRSGHDRQSHRSDRAGRERVEADRVWHDGREPEWRRPIGRGQTPPIRSLGCKTQSSGSERCAIRAIGPGGQAHNPTMIKAAPVDGLFGFATQNETKSTPVTEWQCRSGRKERYATRRPSLRTSSA